jgi:uncharacterized protein (DUF1697 family)
VFVLKQSHPGTALSGGQLYVALLRGVNVGGANKVDMKELKSVFEANGMESVRTYINSGNVIFSTKTRGLRKLGSLLKDAIISGASTVMTHPGVE